MQCYICDGEMNKIQKDVEITWKGKTVIFKGLNVYACRSCGEEAYEPDDVKAMQYLIEGAIKQDDYPEIRKNFWTQISKERSWTKVQNIWRCLVKHEVYPVGHG